MLSIQTVTRFGVLFLTCLCLTTAARAQTCTAEQVAAAVDRAGAALRDLTARNQVQLDQRIRQLRQRNNWPEAAATDLALEMLSDARTAELDKTSAELMFKIDQLGNVPPRTTPECARVEALEAASVELQAAVRVKAAHLIARADAELGGQSSPAASPTPLATASPPTAQPAVRADVKPPTKSASPLSTGWATKTIPNAAVPVPVGRPDQSVEAQKLPPIVVRPQGSAPQAMPLPREEDTYTIDEIVRASSGLFGKVSAGLGSMVEHAFSSIGRPTGYILGEEGGGAFLAGVRYGSGTLYLRDGRTMKIYWHGPSVGWDIGAQGAKVMFLAYRLREPDQLANPYSGIEGSAFIAGGLGLTLMTNGDTQLAPIRSGLGFRLGANVGYVRFTRRPTWNPF